jgi:peptide/nickel transport system ATP-binding protein
VNPQVLLADEPISMLDVSVRLGVLNLLRGLCDNEKLAVLYITHDIASARYIADETIVMYAGQVVERSDGTTLIDGPTHPYTQLLIASVPDPGDPLRRAPEVGDHADQGQFPAEGCRFAPRCPHAMDVCRTTAPPLFEVATGHESRCWLHESATKVSINGREQGGDISTT